MSLPRASQQLAVSAPAPHTAPRRAQAPPRPRGGRDHGLADRYDLGKHIGSGSYGLVHTCTERGTGKEFAVKVLSKTRAKQDNSRTLRKIAKEMDVLSRLQESSNVVQLQDVLEDGGGFAYIVMELCKGGDLEALMERHGPFSEKAAAAVLYEALKVIAVCHANSVLHGDIKPANFMLRTAHHEPMAAIERGDLGTSWLKAIDFGCSQVIRRTPLSRRTGTPVYMAPEVFKREYGQEADLWSLGIMLYQLIAKRLPFWDTVEQCRSKTLEEVMKAVVYKDIPLDYGPWLSFSEEGLDLLQRLCEREPELRLTAAQALEHPWFQRHLFRPDLTSEEDASSAPLSNEMPLPLTAQTVAPPAPSCTYLRSCSPSSPRPRVRALQLSN